MISSPIGKPNATLLTATSQTKFEANPLLSGSTHMGWSYPDPRYAVALALHCMHVRSNEERHSTECPGEYWGSARMTIMHPRFFAQAFLVSGNRRGQPAGTMTASLEYMSDGASKPETPRI